MDPVSAITTAAAAVPQIIVTIQKVKKLYDAFCDEHTSSAALLKVLIDDIEQFQRTLVQHKARIEERGLQYDGFPAVIGTLEQCIKFQIDYRDLLDKRRRKSVTGAFKTIRFTYEEDEIKRLREQINQHKSNIMLASLNIMLEETRPRDDRPPRIAESTPISIPEQRQHFVETFSSSPPLMSLGSPPSYPGSPRLGPRSSRLSMSRRPASIEELPETEPPSQPTPIRQTTVASSSSVISSPPLGSPILDRRGTMSAPSSLPDGFILPGLALPQAALPYLVAEIFFGTKKVSLKRKPTGQDCDSGRELIIRDQVNNLRFRHRIKMSSGDACYPYTWHSRWKRDHVPLEVDFTGTAADAHSISFKGAPAITAMPKYIFTELQDFKDFQSEVRGKQLEDTFEIRQISSSASSRNGEATDQHVKIWRDFLSQEFSISFYTSAAPKPRHVEFPLNMFDQNLDSDGDLDVKLRFLVGTEPKRARTFSKAFRSPSTDKSVSTTTGSGIFTRHNTDIFSSASSVTTVNSRQSVASFQSDSSQTQGRPNPRSSLESQAKRMRYLSIEFSNEGEISRFKKTFDRLYIEETSRPRDFFYNWQMNTGHRRAGSTVSVSPSGTPFPNSPDLRPRTSVPTDERG